MKALLVSELFSPARGGTAVWFDRVYRRPEAAGSQIVAAAAEDSLTFDPGYPRTVHRINWQRHPWLRPESMVIYARLLRRVVDLTRTGGVEAIHAGRVLPEGLVAVLAGWLCRRPVLVYAHGEEITGWREALKRSVMRWTYRHAHVVLANSEFTRKALLDLGVPSSRITVLHPGVDATQFRPDIDGGKVRADLGIHDGPLILSVGRLHDRKGFDRVIESLPELTETLPDVRYAIVGVGEDEARLRRLAFQKNVADRVHFAGLVSDDELRVWYAACDVFAMPNRDIDGDTEGFGIVYLEAAACGKPAVAGLCGGTGSAVIDGETGIRVDGTNVRAVSAGLKRLLLDPEAAQSMGHRARERVVREFSWPSVARRTRTIHASLTSAASTRPDAVSSFRLGKQRLGAIRGT